MWGGRRIDLLAKFADAVVQATSDIELLQCLNLLLGGILLFRGKQHARQSDVISRFAWQILYGTFDHPKPQGVVTQYVPRIVAVGDL